jgi:hypothetical protein
VRGAAGTARLSGKALKMTMMASKCDRCPAPRYTVTAPCFGTTATQWMTRSGLGLMGISPAIAAPADGGQAPPPVAAATLPQHLRVAGRSGRRRGAFHCYPTVQLHLKRGFLHDCVSLLITIPGRSPTTLLTKFVQSDSAISVLLNPRTLRSIVEGGLIILSAP